MQGNVPLTGTLSIIWRVVTIEKPASRLEWAIVTTYILGIFNILTDKVAA